MDHFGVLFWVTYTTYTPEKPNMDPINIYIYIWDVGFQPESPPFPYILFSSCHV